MKNYPKLFVFLIFSAAIFTFSCQSSGDSNKSVKTTEAAETKTYKSIGIVKKTDVDAGKITVDHEEIPGYMAAMEMTEAVADAKMLEAVKPGDKIEFELQRTNSNLLVTKITKIGETAATNGGEIYKTSCAECHGDRGEGAVQGISLLKGHALKHSEADFVKTVMNGEGEKDKKMPSFKEKLTADQITAVVKFIREDLQKADSKKLAPERP